MGIRDKLRERVEPFLEPGEEICQVFEAQTERVPQLLGPFALFALPALRSLGYRIVVVTDRAVVELEAPRWHKSQPKAVSLRVPRRTRLRPGRRPSVGDIGHIDFDDLWVLHRFWGEVEAAEADYEAGAGRRSPLA